MLFPIQTPSELPAQCYRGGLWGGESWRGREGGGDTRQVDRSRPLSPAPSCFRLSRPGSPHRSSVSSDMNTLSQALGGKDVNILLICSLTRRIAASGRFPSE